MTTTPSPAMTELRAGIRDIAPLALGVVIYGAAFGLLAAQTGINGVETGAMGIGVFAGASQILLVERMQAGVGALAALIAAITINLRLLLMTASLRHELHGRPWWQILLAVHLTSDENWALMHATRAGGRQVGYWYLVGGGLHLVVVWVLSTVLGVYFAGLLPAPERLGLDFAFTAAFIAILVSLFRGRADLLPWAVAVGVAICGSLLWPALSSWAMVAGGIAGALAAGLGAGVSAGHIGASDKENTS